MNVQSIMVAAHKFVLTLLEAIPAVVTLVPTWALMEKCATVSVQSQIQLTL